METLLYIIGWLLWITFGAALIYANLVVYILVYDRVVRHRLNRAVLRKAVELSREESLK